MELDPLCCCWFDPLEMEKDTSIPRASSPQQKIFIPVAFSRAVAVLLGRPSGDRRHGIKTNKICKVYPSAPHFSQMAWFGKKKKSRHDLGWMCLCVSDREKKVAWFESNLFSIIWVYLNSEPRYTTVPREHTHTHTQLPWLLSYYVESVRRPVEKAEAYVYNPNFQHFL